ncbi:RAD55 family ATPase [Salinibaculum salinum]|uniref:RAD55 family ATPase n=1 Tax=Salinibaculum salinum TaxID=3131996 RepID=UPI003A9808E2
MSTDNSMYDLSGVLDVDAVSSIRPGSSLLISGPAMTGKENLLFESLAVGASNGEGAVGVTTGGRAEDVIEDIQSRAPALDSYRLCAIDCRTDSDRQEYERDDGAYINRVAAPADMTGIGIGITKCFDRLHDAGVDEARLGLTNLSTMITYTDKQTVFKFCHVLSSRLDSAEFLGLFTIDSSAHDDQTLQVIKQAFDGLIEIRERDGTREARAMGIQPEPSDWVEL